MTPIQCPRCDREATGGRGVWSESKPHCSSCGWNLERVKASQQENLKFALVFFILIAVAVSAASLFSRHISLTAALGVGAFSLFLLLAAALSWKRLKTLQSVRANATMQVAAINSFATPTHRPGPSFDRMLLTPRPRPLKMKSTGYVFLTSLVMALVGLAAPLAWFVRNGRSRPQASNDVSNLVSFAVFGLILLISFSLVLRSMLRDRRLLAEGEIAIATVTAQSFNGKGKGSKIKYEFKDVAGRGYAGSATDQTQTLYEEMETPVFYNPMNPAENVALVSAMYKLVDS